MKFPRLPTDSLALALGAAVIQDQIRHEEATARKHSMPTREPQQPEKESRQVRRARERAESKKASQK